MTTTYTPTYTPVVARSLSADTTEVLFVLCCRLPPVDSLDCYCLLPLSTTSMAAVMVHSAAKRKRRVRIISWASLTCGLFCRSLWAQTKLSIDAAVHSAGLSALDDLIHSPQDARMAMRDNPPNGTHSMSACLLVMVRAVHLSVCTIALQR